MWLTIAGVSPVARYMLIVDVWKRKEPDRCATKPGKSRPLQPGVNPITDEEPCARIDGAFQLARVESDRSRSSHQRLLQRPRHAFAVT